MSALTQPIKWFGGKHYLARKIVDLFPRHLHYVEPYAGGLSVLLHRDPDDESLWLPPNRGVSEVVNDLDGELTNFWRVLQDTIQFDVFRRHVEAMPMSRIEWDDYRDLDASEFAAVGRAIRFFVLCRQSRSGMMKDFTSITRSRTRRQMNGNVSEWLGAVDGLPDVHARLRRVLVENMDAVKLIEREDTPGTLFYLDPPYLHSTRTAGGYAHEMSEDQHRHLLTTLLLCEGKVILSGYPSELYDSTLSGWRTVDFDLPNHAAGGDSKRRMTERLWLNF